MQKNIIVVGAPRSGTSLTARVFARQGYYFGGAARKAVVQGDDYNPFGYFEADDLIERNVSLFRRVEFNCHNTWLFDQISDAQVAAIRNLDSSPDDRLLVDDYDRCQPWLWKDPRLCFTLDYWRRIVDSDSTAVVVVLRNPDDVVESFRHRGWIGPGQRDRSQTTDRIRRHQDVALDAYERFRGVKACIQYRDYAAKPREVVDTFNGISGLNLTVPDLNFRSDLDHSSYRGRLAGWGRMVLRSLPRGTVRRMERWVPNRVAALVFPERKYVVRGQ